MKSYEDAVKELTLFTELNNATVERFVREMDNIEGIRNFYNNEYEGCVASVRDLANNAKSQCNQKISRRRNFVSNTVNELKNMLAGIQDPHFHRMEKKYTLQVRGNRLDTTGLQEEELIRKANEELTHLRELVGKLNQAFLPAGVSNVIGVVVPAHRKKAYKRIIEVRNKLLDYVEPLLNVWEMNALVEEINEVYENRVAREQHRLDQQLATLPDVINDKTSMILENYNRALEVMNAQTGVFHSETRPITLGLYMYRTNYISLFEQTNLSGRERVVLEGTDMCIPVAVESLHNNYSYLCSGENQIHRYFISTTLDMLKANPNNEVVFIDVAGLGSNYAVLNKLTSTGHVSIWSTEEQVLAGLGVLEAWIASIYSENLAERYESLEEYNYEHDRKKPEKYVFINDLKTNLVQRDLEKLERIVKNGRRAGVYVIVSVKTEDLSDRHFCEVYGEMQADMKTIAVENMVVKLGTNTCLVIKSAVERAKIDEVHSLLQGKNEQQEMIPLGKYLPESNAWHTMSAAQEIVIPFGIDVNGRIAVLKISSEKPYVMIIGDPRHGKSKLMHTIIMMATSHYGEDEIKVAVMDLKDGAEFNVYARAGIKSVECVVNDEDPDAMLSFLRYYVAQMQSRQELFVQMEEATGTVVQKYEDYRSANMDMHNALPQMPRLLLLIDEFQTLFDGSASAAYMSELVRKGATYGIHVILSSQRAVSSNPRNGFTSDLKDYFTNRFVFKCPQRVAGTVLSERCADTGRENSGIHKASLLAKGHAIYNAYMGQNESDNREVQCFFPSTELVTQFVDVMENLKGGGRSILLKKNAKSVVNKSCGDGLLYLGESVRVRHDAATSNQDTIKDDISVALSMEENLYNMILSGNDIRIVASFVSSLRHFSKVNRRKVVLNVLGRADSFPNITEENEYFRVTQYQDIEAQLNMLEAYGGSSNGEYIVNLLVEPDIYEEYVQTMGGLRKSRGAELLKGVLGNTRDAITVTYTKSFRNIRSSLQYLVTESPIHISSVGDAENVRMSMSENIHLVAGEFDVPRKESIKAYYYNKHTEKYGKMVMYCV